MSAGRYSRGRQESTTFQDAQLTSPKRFACGRAAAAVCRRRERSTRRMRVGDGRWWKSLHSPGRIIRAAWAAHRSQPFHGTYRIGPSRLWPGGMPFRNTVCQNHACRCRPPVRERRRAYRPSVPVAGGMMRPNGQMGMSGEGFFRKWLKRMECWRRVFRIFWSRTESKPPSSGPSGHLRPGGEKKYAVPSAWQGVWSLFFSPPGRSAGA